MINKSTPSANHQISSIEVTNDLLVDRGGLAPLMRFVKGLAIVPVLAGPLQKFRQGGKGASVPSLLTQLIAFFCDGSSRHLTYFDHLKKDAAYAGLLETKQDALISSHQIKRFFSKLPPILSSQFRGALREMFAARLRQEKPQRVEIFLDTMVLDNDDALKRQGVEPTYKKVKGFQPLQLIWNGLIIDAQFRGGKKNGNHGLTAFHMIDKAAKVIRKTLGYDVQIIVRMDGGFFDGDLFWRLDATNIGFVCTARQSKAIKAAANDQATWRRMDGGKQSWHFTEFAFRCLRWKRFYRTIYLKPVYDDDQMILEFARPESVIITNIGTDHFRHCRVEEAGDDLSLAETLIREHHAKGADELTHRALKDFGFQQMPFKKFGANTAFYYMMVIAHNLMTWYTRDVLSPCGLVGKRSYATTVRRVAIDFAAKIVRTGRQTVLKVTASCLSRLNLHRVWEMVNEVRPLRI